ncbi:DUF2567 domain-containing protein [Mycobacterium deserti]|uniref:DUF2567 domain-containing protein n=1 Tax=Mycobacterium deserti TaxID=2978347 RepID=A0ABT2MC67_9MYCO|nr:DUF2567 domain-containing protein [Mycobacterium deserti]MCT7659868.1 DUF2567 domain-containing protein [Mycobacterium deserti]
MNDIVAPRVSRRRAALVVAAGLASAGVLVGALWAWVAPPAHGVVALTESGDRIRAYLGNDADHLFVAAFMVVGMTCVLAVVGAVLVWQWRAHRGPVLVTALTIGAAAAAGAAAGVGALIAHWRYGSIDVAAAPVSPEHRVHYVVEAPPVFFGHSPLLIAMTFLFPAATAALVYTLIAVSTARDDLGAWPPQEPPVPAPPVQASPAVPGLPHADAAG